MYSCILLPCRCHGKQSVFLTQAFQFFIHELLRYYIAPLVSLGVVNAGNLFGFVVSGVLIGAGIFWQPLIAFLKNVWAKGAGKAALSVLCVLTVLFCSAFFVTLGQIIHHAHYTATDESTVLVLGCQIRGSVPSMTLRARCAVAADYLKKHPDAVAIATGGQGADEDLSEGQCIFNLMTEAGISPDRIYIEDKSTNTYSNVENALEIIEKNDLSRKVAVATSEYHQYRAAFICRQNGLTASAIPAASTRLSKPTFYTREVFGVWVQWLTARSAG